LLDNHVIIIAHPWAVSFSFVFLILTVDECTNDWIENAQSASLAILCALIEGSNCKVHDLFNILLLADDIEVFFGFEHVHKNGASVHVVFICFFWTQCIN
jgi:hypothetical protein